MSARWPGGVWLWVALIAAAAVTRFWDLGRESVWLDEAVSLRFASEATALRLDGLFFTHWGETHPPLYYLLLAGWRGLFGSSEVAIRSLPALFGVALVPATLWTGRRLSSPPVALIAALLVLVNPVALYYAQEGRMYSFTALLVVLSVGTLWSWLESRRRGPALLYALVGAALLYTHHLSVLLLAVQGLFAWRRLGSLRAAGLPYAAMAVAYVPWLPNALFHTEWGRIAWMTAPGGRDVASMLRALAGIEFYRDHDFGLLHVAALASLAALFGLGAVRSWGDGFRGRLLLACAAMPVAFWLISATAIPILNLRQASIHLALLLIVLAWGLWTLHDVAAAAGPAARTAWWVSLLGIVIINLHAGYTVFAVDSKEDWRSVARHVAAASLDGPVVVSQPYMRRPLRYYWDDGDQVIGLSELDLGEVEERVGRAPVFTLVLSQVGSEEAALARIGAGYRVAEETEYRGVRVYRMERVASAGAD